jgi:hypothetical protein
MSKFQLNITTTNQTETKERKVVDWNAMNEHVVEAAGTATKTRSIPGVISGVYDLGEQKLEDAAIPVTDDKFKQAFPEFDGSQEQQDAVIAKYANRTNVRFEKVDNKLCLRYVQNPVQQVAVSVDFPQILVDKGQFFGNSKPLPLRLLYNGEFTTPGDKTKIVGRPFNLRDTKHDLGNNKSVWAFAKNNGLHKFAAAAELLDENGLFNKERVGELIGKVVQFQVRVWMKPAKTGDKKFFTEEISLVGIVPEGVAIPEVPEGLLHMVNLHGENDAEAVKQMRVAIKNTMKRALNYDTSSLKPVFEAEAASYGNKPADAAKDAVKEAVKAAEVTPVPVAFDDDIPF